MPGHFLGCPNGHSECSTVSALQLPVRVGIDGIKRGLVHWLGISAAPPGLSDTRTGRLSSVAWESGHLGSGGAEGGTVGTSEWETEVYAKGRQVNRWPFSDLVSDIMNDTAGRDCSELSVLDLGCGTGNNVWFFLDTGMRASGIDISPTAIEMAGKRIRDLGFEQPDLRVGSITELPWPDGVFDFVIDRGTLSYLLLDEIAATVREVSRVLKPGGKFFSYYLFGWNSSDRELGEEFAPRSFRGFCGGRFAKSPTVTLLDAAMIHQLWEPLVIRQLRRHEVTVEGTGVVEEFFDVQAVTYLADSPGH